jgi:hypothetical protein
MLQVTVDLDTAIWLREKSLREDLTVPELVRRIIERAKREDAS